MTVTWIMTLLGVALVSLVSLIGIIAMPRNKAKAQKITHFLISMAAGAMLGNAFIHLLPESFEEMAAEKVSLLVLSGIFVCFSIEKLLHGDHWHGHDCDVHNNHDHIHPTGYLSLVADGLENIIDGIMIGTAFLVSVPVGIASVFAVILHEIPLEMGDFAVLTNAGFSRKKALLFNFASAALAGLSAILTLSIGSWVDSLPLVLMPIAAGASVYMALAGLVPQLHKHRGRSVAVTQLFSMFLGVGLMLLLVLFE
jgi:zinc and cadmium transporter